MKDAVLIAPLAIVVPSVAIESAVLRVVSRDQFTFVRDSVDPNPTVRHNNVTDVLLSIYVHEEYRHVFEAVDSSVIIEADEAEEEEEAKPKGRRRRAAAKEEVSNSRRLIEIDCGLVQDSIVREVGILPLLQSAVYEDALDELEKHADTIEDNAGQLEAIVGRIALLQQKLQTGNIQLPASTLASDLVPQVGSEMEKLNMDAIARQEQIIQNEIVGLRTRYDKILDWFESKVFPKVAEEEDHFATVDTFRELGIQDLAEPKKIVALIRNNLISL